MDNFQQVSSVVTVPDKDKNVAQKGNTVDALLKLLLRAPLRLSRLKLKSQSWKVEKR